ncbi:MAG: signal peptidase I [Actinomycetota bacterium]
MPRVYEVARELGISSRSVLDKLAELGAPATSHASSIDEATAGRVRAGLTPADDGDAAPAAATAPATTTAPTAPTQNGPPAPEATTVLPPPPPWTGGVRAPAQAPAPAARPRRAGVLKTLAELPMLVLFAFLVAIVIKTFLVQAFYIPSTSMLPTLHKGDRVLVEKLSYYFGDAERGEVVVFAKDVFGQAPDEPWTGDARNLVRELLGLPTGNEEDYIKRVVAIGGDSISYTGTPRELRINGEPVPQSFVAGGRDRSSPTLTAKDCARLEMDRAGRGCRVPAGKIFVMGDNRNDSEDSRILGPVDEDKIVGRAFVVIWPFGNYRGL